MIILCSDEEENDDDRVLLFLPISPEIEEVEESWATEQVSFRPGYFSLYKLLERKQPGCFSVGNNSLSLCSVVL